VDHLDFRRSGRSLHKIEYGESMSYLSFTEIPNQTRKTKRWNVSNSQDGSQLGMIVFSGAWRKYVFNTAVAQFDAGCLDEISNFLKEQTGLWRNSL
jgi:hypothetical protein